jgi:predicted DCC family thiol-disulfide oxidoreductase YuxK
VSGLRRPTLLYDGDCGFCRRWIERWREITVDRVVYSASKEAGHHFPQVDPALYAGSVVFVDADGAVFLGADAVFRALSTASGWAWLSWLYQRIPAFAAVAERAYAGVARHRMGFSRVTRWLWGRDLRLPRYQLVRWVFLRGLGLIYLVAFLSLWAQLDGLMGAHGVQPAREWLELLSDRFGRAAYWQAPTIFWLNASDTVLWLGALGGVAASALLVANRAPFAAAVAAWILYLSMFAVGGVFFSFQWDILLLETGFLAMLLAPRVLRPRLQSEPPAPRTVIFLLRWLVFRLMLLSGLVKLASGDSAWWDLTALTFHYETQPLPSWTSWIAHNLPEGFHRFSCAVMFAIELVLPFFVWAPRRLRVIAAGGFVALQLGIMATGNYNFFNLLTCLLCVPLLDDGYLARVMPLRLVRSVELRGMRSDSPSGIGAACLVSLALVLVMLGTAQGWARLAGADSVPRPVRRVLAAAQPFHLASPYGLFAVMTKQRREIVIEGSADGENWKPYEFRWKPGDPAAKPRFCQPHQPRLDWQMWFAALGTYRNNPWLIQLMDRLLEGSQPVLDLLGENPFPQRPPSYVRAVIYEYRFHTITGARAEGTWWRRGAPRPYAPIRTSAAD